MKRGARRLAGGVLAMTLLGNPILHGAEPRDPGGSGPRPAGADSGTRPQPSRTLAGAVESHAATADPAVALQPPAAPADAEPQRPFFKTRRGVVTGVLMVAGLSWVLYSKSHDRVRSPAND